MAAPLSSQSALNPTGGASGPSAQSRWGRSGEPGSAFSGLSRPGRGRGNSRGRGGGRGGRGGATTRETKIGETSGVKIDTTMTRSASAANAASKPESVAHPSGREKTSVPSNSVSSRPKGPSRKASRVIPTVAVAPSSPSAPPSPVTTRPNHRRKRSQTGKTITPPNIRVPPHDDNTLRPPRNRIASAPHSAPVKDTPPHLTKSFDIRNNIDALVERVRAVAMADNRPSTPGSHIDWAGDDDDSLPDLDDWGVTPGIPVGEKEEMSPIIVDGLKSLPELNVLPSYQGQQPIDGKHPPSGGDLSGKEQKVLSAVPQLNTAEKDKSPKIASINPVSNTATQGPATAAKLLLHPSLPAKPTVLPEVSLPKSRHGPAAMPMRKPSPQRPFNAPAERPESILIPSTGRSTGQLQAPPDQLAAVGPLHSAPADDLLLKDNSSISAPLALNEPHNKEEGLSASIHAPQTLLESTSAPAGLGSYSSPRTTAIKTHARAHTVEKPFVSNSDFGRPSRSGYSTPQGGVSSEGYHARTHSSPPAGVMLNNHRNHHGQRPVLTGDALSRLARTIGSNALSPPRAATVIASHD
ncbi:hypothetical protein L208DRAFT_1377643 [Tricholoma matsutake]|nr:hypothetical protein L208DRAFT_1377643 [Tricholoma matsutake 945]